MQRIDRKGAPSQRKTELGMDTDSDCDVAPVRRRGYLPALREQAVDEVLQLKIYESVVHGSPESNGRWNTIVLATCVDTCSCSLTACRGDGAQSEYSVGGFVRPIEAALRIGFDVEIVAWSSGLNAVWRRLERETNVRVSLTG